MMTETAFPYLRRELQQIHSKKPNITEVKTRNKVCEIVEVTVCFDLYISESYRSTYSKYQQLKYILDHHKIRHA